MARAPDEADHGDVVVLRDPTDFALGDARQVEHHDASAVERDEHLPRRDVDDTSLNAKDGLLLSTDRRGPNKRQDERSQHETRWLRVRPLGDYLALFGALVLTGPTALEALPQVVMSDVVVTDSAMSGRDGRWFVGQVETSARPVSVIAVTGYGEDYDLSGAPFARVLTKPVDPETLAAEILQVLGRKSA